MSGELAGVPAGFYEIRDVNGEKLVQVAVPQGTMTIPDLRILIAHLTRIADTAEQMQEQEITR